MFFFFFDERFIGRTAELSELQKRSLTDKFQFCAVFGRRRIGKTHLLHKFLGETSASGIKVISFTAAEQGDYLNLSDFSAQVRLTFPEDAKYVEVFSDWQAVYDFIADRARQERVILLIDEFPYLAKSNPSLVSILQRTIDQSWSKTKLFLILCGSSMSFMRNQLLGVESPLYGRITMQLSVKPFDFFDAVRMLPAYQTHDQYLTAYGTVGGVAHYLRQFEAYTTVREAIIRTLLQPTSALYEEPARLLQQELREPAIYNSIVKAVASGMTRQNEIADRVRMPANRISPYLSTLIELGVLSRETPVGEPVGSRKGIYVVADALFRFWFRFVAAERSNLENGLAERTYDETVAAALSGFLGSVFEHVAIEYLHRRNRETDGPFHFREIGRWWGADPISKQEAEIDLVAIGTADVWFGECKWWSVPVGYDSLLSLRRKATHLFPSLAKRFVLFSKSGFSDELIALTRTDDAIRLFTYEDLVQFAKTAT